MYIYLLYRSRPEVYLIIKQIYVTLLWTVRPLMWHRFSMLISLFIWSYLLLFLSLFTYLTPFATDSPSRSPQGVQLTCQHRRSAIFIWGTLFIKQTRTYQNYSLYRISVSVCCGRSQCRWRWRFVNIFGEEVRQYYPHAGQWEVTLMSISIDKLLKLLPPVSLHTHLFTHQQPAATHFHGPLTMRQQLELAASMGIMRVSQSISAYPVCE